MPLYYTPVFPEIQIIDILKRFQKRPLQKDYTDL